MDLQRLMAMVIHLSMVMMMMIMMVLMMCWVVCQVMSNPTLFIVTVLTSLFQQYLTVTLLAIIFDNDVMLFHHVCMGNQTERYMEEENRYMYIIFINIFIHYIRVERYDGMLENREL